MHHSHIDGSKASPSRMTSLPASVVLDTSMLSDMPNSEKTPARYSWSSVESRFCCSTWAAGLNCLTASR